MNLVPLPGAEKVRFKKAFVERYSLLTDWEEFKKYSLSYLRKSIRVNTLKASVRKVKEVLSDWRLEQVPWCKEGFFIEHKIEERFDIGNTKAHFLGYVFVQEAASMIPPVVLDAKPGEFILDMCAAPGAKTTQIAAMMQNKGLLIANDVSYERIKLLGMNLQRCGVSNHIITIMKGQSIKGLEFDRILVDAPCSATGAIRKNLNVIKEWNPAQVKRLSSLQKKLIRNAYRLLKPKGVLVYSTCSVEPEENEEVVDYLLRKFDDAKVEGIRLKIKRSEPITKFRGKEYTKEVEKCLRIWPQDNNTEGFFVAKIRKG